MCLDLSAAWPKAYKQSPYPAQRWAGGGSFAGMLGFWLVGLFAFFKRKKNLQAKTDEPVIFRNSYAYK